MGKMLIEIYRESNEHLRASDTKRDQIIAFYLIIIGLFFGALDKLGDVTKLIALSIFGLGILISFTLISLRKWHIVYVNTSIVIQHLTLNKIKPTEPIIEEVWEKLINNGDHKEKKSVKVGRIFHTLSTENLTYITFIVITFTPFYLVYPKLEMIGIHILYVIVMSTISYFLLKYELSEGYRASWLLRINDPYDKQ